MNFSRPNTFSAIELAAVRAGVRSAAASLGRHVGAPVRATFDEGHCRGAAQVPGLFRLEIAVGCYSTLRRRPPEEDVREWQARRDAAPREIGVDATAAVEWLIDQEIAISGGFGCEHAFVEAATVEDAAEWVRENCHKAPVARVSARELEQWTRETVHVPAAETTEEIPLSEAVKIYGALHSRDISVAQMMEVHGISPGDARRIVAAVMKVLPRRKAT